MRAGFIRQPEIYYGNWRSKGWDDATKPTMTVHPPSATARPCGFVYPEQPDLVVPAQHPLAGGWAKR